ncbi:hypothetical protein FHS72_003346 [Loktanella ponticola]|uniref:PRC-barrel domain containing protein n=1 Tax=Yoonia ponticola TaxID=1524255 RepID=A0A7W9F175_9RHOB|nr:PRC-barrel domain-containing protein [Yoonia ponticola]MBB5723701.1 hypothetical protein [Yoonia ponticola]
MDHSKHPRLEATELNALNLEGATVYGPDDETIGDVSHLHGEGPSTQVVLDAGGFLGIGSKRVGLDIGRLDFMRDASGTVHATTDLTKDEVKALPEHRD